MKKIIINWCNYLQYLMLTILVILSSFSFAQKKNIVFIAVDDLKPIIGAYEDTLAKTPDIDKLAEMGFVFKNAYTQQAVCGPSRASLLTGLRPDYTEVRDLKTLIRDKNPNIITLPEVFKMNGYETYAVGKIFDPRSVDKGHDTVSWTIPYISPEKLPGEGPRPKLGYYQSPEHVATYNKYAAIANAKGLKGRKKINFIRKYFKPSTEKANVPDDAYLDGRIANNAIEEIDKMASGKKPFFLAVGFKKPHLPFVAPTKYWNLYNPKDFHLAQWQQYSIDGPLVAYHGIGELGSYTDIPAALGKDGILSKEKQLELIHGYYAAASYVDTQIGKIINKLKQKGLLKNTIIVLWGDHGYHLGDHKMWCKHTDFEQATRAPLIFFVPGEKPGRTSNPTEFLDIYPTLCELAGIMPAKGIQGKSLVPVLEGKSPKKTFAISQWPTHHAHGGIGYSMRVKRYRYTEWYNTYKSTSFRNEKDLVASELYDYKLDPLETRNVVNSKKYKIVCDSLRKILHTFLDSQVRTKTSTEFPGDPKGPSLRSLLAKDFKAGNVYLGSAIAWSDIGTPVSNLLVSQFNYLTPENAAKESTVHPSPKVWSWKKVDKIVKFANENDIAVRLHAPISPQCSKWAKEDNRTPKELLKNMTEYMTAICKHFNENKAVKWMDVVNETVNKDGTWFGPKPGTDKWENPWLTIGMNKDGSNVPLYITKAFEIATKYAPNIKFVYNQHLGMDTAAWNRIKTTILYLRKRGYRVDALGWQAHLKPRNRVSMDPKKLEYLGKLIDWAHAHGLEFFVTEIDYHKNPNAPYDKTFKKKQALAFANILKVLLSRQNTGVVTYNTWGLYDHVINGKMSHAHMFDNLLRAKPAYYSVQQVLEHPNDLAPVYTVN